VTQESDITGRLQIVQRLRVHLVLAVEQLDAALILKAAVDGHLLSGPL
jgi:hypothetical protein